MWFGSVDIPEQLVSAHRAGELVLFVGAGASMAAPSSLPDFVTLAKRIAAESSITLSPEEIKEPDFALGRINLLRVDVHQRVADLVSDSASQPNRLHAAIVDLALAEQPVRIVTTNYDRHLSSVVETRGGAIDEFAGPALPMGDNFEGLVHLHGGLHQDPSRLVITDEDFGHAYLVDAWAARFLEKMYRSYKVLFIGYSHSDTVMRYMARALGPQSERYALTDETSADAHWKQLGITPIRYQLVGGSHQALDVAVESWAKLAGTGLLGHRERIAKLVAGPPPNVPEDVSYLEESLLDARRAQIFAEAADGLDWLNWVAERPPFDRLFDASSFDDAPSAVLAWWFALNFVVVENHTAEALSISQRNRGVLGPIIWRAIAGRIHSTPSPRPVWLNPWIALLVESAPSNGRESLEYILRGCNLPNDEAVALLLFEYLSSPQVSLEPSYGIVTKPRFSVDPLGDHYWLDECWQLVLKPHLPTVASNVVLMMDGHLRRARYFLSSGGPTLDSVSFRRHAIEHHPQDSVPQAMDVLIDAARDCIEALLESRDPLGPALLESWARSGVPILERLSVHGWCHRTDVNADQKVEKLTAEGWVFKVELRHEAFILVAQELAKASMRVGDAFIRSVEDWMPDDS